MALLNFPILNVSDKNLQLIQANVQRAVTDLQASPFVPGNLISTMQSSTGATVPLVVTSGQDNLISHMLGYTPKTFVIANTDTNSTFWSPISPQLLDAKGTAVAANSTSINIRCSATSTIALWVN